MFAAAPFTGLSKTEVKRVPWEDGNPGLSSKCNNTLAELLSSCGQEKTLNRLPANEAVQFITFHPMFMEPYLPETR